MAALAALPLPAPAALRTSYADLFDQNDPWNGNYGSIFQPSYDLSVAPVTPPEQVRMGVVNARQYGHPTALLVAHEVNGVVALHIYVQLSMYTPQLGQPASQWDNQFFAIKGELVHNRPTIVAWGNNYFHQTAQHRVPTIAAITAALAGDPDATELGPFTDVDADTEVIRTRGCMFVPPPYVRQFLVTGSLTPREAWERVGTQVVADGNEVACKPFLDFLRGTLTVPQGNGDIPALQAVPVSPLADPPLQHHIQRILVQDFPGMGTAAGTAQQNQIAAEVGNLRNDMMAARVAEEQRRVQKEARSVEDYLGQAAQVRMCRMSHVGQVANLAPVYDELASSAPKHRLKTLQDAIDQEKEAMGEPELPFVVQACMLAILESGSLHMVHNDAVDTGANPFQFDANPNIVSAKVKQALYAAVLGRGMAPSTQEMQDLMAASIKAPTSILEGLQQTKILECFLRVALGSAHVVPAALRKYNTRLTTKCLELETQAKTNVLLPVLLNKKLAVLLSNWFRKQALDAAVRAAPDFEGTLDSIENDDVWQPTLSILFCVNLGLPSPPADASRLLLSPQLPAWPPAGTPVGPPAGPPMTPAGGKESDQVPNKRFNAGFARYVDTKPSAREIKERIDLPATDPQHLSQLPNSKNPNPKPGKPNPMCPAWHLKGKCNKNCGRIYDHVFYTGVEYQELMTWCTACLPQ
jgi:hypothetical protein